MELKKEDETSEEFVLRLAQESLDYTNKTTRIQFIQDMHDILNIITKSFDTFFVMSLSPHLHELFKKCDDANEELNGELNEKFGADTEKYIEVYSLFVDFRNFFCKLVMCVEQLETTKKEKDTNGKNTQ